MIFNLEQQQLYTSKFLNALSVERNLSTKTLLAEYSCAMKSHFRKFGNQMSGSGNHLCNYASLLA